MFHILQALHKFLATANSFFRRAVLPAGVILMFLGSIWVEILAVAGGIAAVIWVWSTAGGFAAAMAAVAFIAFGILYLVANSFRL